ncbi:ABC transporter permease [Humibacter ginsenosidimutans]|uniref:ABC transporter permease n=1 Tax=Humibacter ginsenosidimutans TaxID=2599293 RepID=A0A5B8M483_9MICO|nr:ABC transporter permease [Humibacter ginsenosidimutans]QDZ15123.1 ABC transporter permease [Humibacter ginsenosidimutans]
MRFYLQKIAFYVVALWAAVTINFFIPRMMPGNPVDIMMNKMSAAGMTIAPGTRHALEIELGGGSGNILQQYGDYIVNLLHGNLGISSSNYPEQVTTMIGQALPWTIALVGLATVISFILGVGLGMLAGWKRGSWLDNLIPVTTMFQSVPYFWLALILVLVLTRVIPLFPYAGGYNVATTTPGFSLDFIGSAIYYGFLPALTIVLSSIGGWMLGMRNMMVSTLSEDYIVTAEAKGLNPRRVRMTYAARNAVLPSLSGFAISLGFVVAGSIVTEQVFSYPGIGQLLFSSVSNNDYTLMQGVFLVISLSVLGANLVVDVLNGIIDPRTRARS